MQELQGKVALVTGASTGVGEAIALYLYQCGATVIITGRDKEALQIAANKIDKSNVRVTPLVMDVTCHESVATGIAQIEHQNGALHYLVNNAGITGPHGVSIEDYPLDEWNQVIATDISGTFYGLKYGIPAIVRSGGGAVVNLSACNGVTGIAGIAPYTAAKHAVLGLTRATALEYAQKGVRVNAIGPGYVATPNILTLPVETQSWMAEMHPMGRMAKCEEIAKTVGFLLSDDSSFITGAFIPVDGGYTAQ